MAQIFVYGSLRNGMYNYKRYLDGKSSFVDYGYVKGELYTLHDVCYPALLRGDDNILGEIYEVDEACIKELDVLEGFQEGNPQNDYDKVDMEVYIKGQATPMILPVYIFNLKKEDNLTMLDRRIVGNDYVQYMKDMKI